MWQLDHTVLWADKKQHPAASAVASRIAAQRIERANARAGLHEKQVPHITTNPFPNSVKQPSGPWGNQTYGAWYSGSNAGNTSAKVKAFGAAAHASNDASWEFGKIGVPLSMTYGSHISTKAGGGRLPRT